MSVITYREALNQAIFEEMQQNPVVFIMGEGIAERGGIYQVTAGLLKKFGGQRVIDTPIAEATFTGAAVGAALVGTRPIVEILFGDFTTLAMDQLVNQAAKVVSGKDEKQEQINDLKGANEALLARLEALESKEAQVAPEPAPEPQRAVSGSKKARPKMTEATKKKMAAGRAAAKAKKDAGVATSGE